MLILNLVVRKRFCKLRKSLQIFELSPPVTQKEIKAKYLELAKQMHPDSGQTAESSKFAEINQAYQYLRSLPESSLKAIHKTQQNLTQNEWTSTDPDARERARTRQYFYTRPNLRAEGFPRFQSKIPLYKSVPELFIGFMFVFAIIGDLIYNSIKAKQKQPQSKPKMKEDKNPFAQLGIMRKYRVDKNGKLQSNLTFNSSN